MNKTMPQSPLTRSLFFAGAALIVACSAPKPAPVDVVSGHTNPQVTTPSAAAEAADLADPRADAPPSPTSPSLAISADQADFKVAAPAVAAEVTDLPGRIDPEIDAPAAAAEAPAFPDHADPKVNASFVAADLNVKLWTDRFEGESREVYRAREALIAALDLKAGMQVADIGAGTGLFVKYLADAVGPTGAVFAVDIAEPFLAQIKARAAKAGLSQVTTVRGAATKTNLAAASIDLAWICDVYHHFEDPKLMLADLHRAIRVGGRLAVVDFHRIPGVSSAFILGHVRADKATFVAEIEAAGFRRLPEVEAPYLVENYLVIFERVAP